MKKLFENTLVLVMKTGVQLEKVEAYFKTKLFSAKSLVSILFSMFILIGVFGSIKMIQILLHQFEIPTLIFLVFTVLVTFLFIALTYSLIKDIKIARDDKGFKVVYPNQALDKKLSALESIVIEDNISKSLAELSKKHIKCSPTSYKNYLGLEPLESTKILWCDSTGATRYKYGNLQTLLEFIKITFDLAEEEYHLLPEIVDTYFLNTNSEKFKFHQNTIHRWKNKTSKYIEDVSLELKEILF